MVRALSLTALVGLLVLVPAASAARSVTPAESEALLRIASRLSGLPAKRAVPVVVDRPAQFRLRRTKTFDQFYPMSAQAYDEILYRSLGLTAERNVLRPALVESQVRTAMYDPVSRRIFVPTAKPARQPLLGEFVRALQDQHFGLRRPAVRPGSRDESIATIAALEGHVALVAGVPATRSVSGHGGPLLTRFLELQRGFTTFVGRRFALNLRNLGGNPAIFAALRRLPSSTEQIFHLDKFLERERALPIVLPVDAAGLRLAADNSFGELDVRALLAVFDVPRLDHAGSGWGGGRTAIYRGAGREAVAVALDWDTELDAQQWAEAAALYVNEAFDADAPALPAPTTCAASTCWSFDGRSVAFVRAGARTVLVVSGDVAGAAALARAIVPG